jgi:hypothetical protein
MILRNFFETLRRSRRLNIRTEDDDEMNWNDFSLDNAMRGLEDDNMPEYFLDDLKERWS